MKTKIIALASFLALLMTACFNFGEENKATLTLHLSGSSNSRAALTNWPPVNDAELGTLSYEIKLKSSSGAITEKEASGSDSIITFSVTPGNWTIEVTAKTDGELYAYGVTGATLIPGQNNVLITMNRAGHYEIKIDVLPFEISILKGGNYTFTANTFYGDSVNNDDMIHDSYKWSVSGQRSGATTINESTGYLTVDLNETANTLTVKAKSANKDSIYGTATVNVADPTNALAPTIQIHPQDKIYSVGERETLTVVAILPSGSGTLSYQWYSNSTNSNSGGTPIPGETNASYTLPTGTAGMLGITTYYYVEVTNTDNTANGNKTAMTTSNVAAVTVTDQYTVTFDGNGANGTVPPVQFAYAGSAITLPNEGSLSKTGYTFVGWNTQADGNGTDYSIGYSYTPTVSVILYAKWTPKPVAITFDSNGGTDGAVTSLSGKFYDQTVDSALPSSGMDIPTRLNYTFIGWSTNSGGNNSVNFTSSTVINTTNGVTGADTLTLYAVWVPDEITSSPTGIVMVWIPAGTFQMGESGDANAEPVHQVTLTTGFYMGKYPVTQDEYVAVMGSNPSSFSSSPAAGEVQGRRPVESVSWYDALVFCNKLSVADGLTPAYKIGGSTDPAVWGGGTVPIVDDTTWNDVEIVPDSTGYRLPTEAQWEYACRAGTTSKWFVSPNSSILDSALTPYAWFTSNWDGITHQVGKKSANPWGLHDILGNVWEWCWDRYESSYSSYSSPQMDPTGPSSGTARVRRGGSLTYGQFWLRSAARDGDASRNPWGNDDQTGIRVVRP